MAENKVGKEEVLLTPDDGSPYSFHVELHRHDFYTDEPNSVGGRDMAPAPYEFLLSGLGGCTAITLQMYADHKGIDLGDFSVHLSFHRNEDKALIIEKTLTFNAGFSQEQLDKFKEISKKCPMHKDLSPAVQINTVVKVR